MLSKEQIEKINRILIPVLSPYFIILFGSIAVNRERASSDIDIAFLADESIGSYDLFMTAQQVASALDREVDLISLNQVSTVMQMEILYNGKIIYSSDEEVRKEFMMKVYKMYTRLNEERQVVLQAVKERGDVYG